MKTWLLSGVVCALCVVGCVGGDGNGAGPDAGRANADLDVTSDETTTATESPDNCECFLGEACLPRPPECSMCVPEECDGVCTFAGCVECAMDTDCSPTEECDSGTCRSRCLGDDDCPGNGLCGFDGLCEAAIGAPCESSRDCGSVLRSCINVDATLQTVEPYCSADCIEDSGNPEYRCPLGFACQEGECRRAGIMPEMCMIDAHCGLLGVCDASTGTCVECTEDAQCRQGFPPIGACDTSTNKCVECVDSADCFDGACDVNEKVCVECVSDADCADEVLNTLCDAALQECVDCDPTRCDGVCGDFGCVECMQASDCAPNQECRVFECRTRCNMDADCDSNNCSISGLCDPAVGTACDPLNNSCGSGRCRDVDAAGLTVDGYCSRSCSDLGEVLGFDAGMNGGCPAGFACQGGDCLKL